MLQSNENNNYKGRLSVSISKQGEGSLLVFETVKLKETAKWSLPTKPSKLVERGSHLSS